MKGENHMDIQSSYTKLSQSIIKEHKEVFERLSMEELSQLIDAIIKAKRIFVMGAGREGISLRGFAMRLAHLGKPTYWIWDDTTTGIQPDDLFIVSDGCGDVGLFRYILKRVKQAGGIIAMFTGEPDGNNAKKYADIIVFIHATAYLAHRDDVVPTAQIMGNQYEQHLYMLCDIIIMLLVEKLGLTYSDLEKRHRNVE